MALKLNESLLLQEIEALHDSNLILEKDNSALVDEKAKIVNKLFKDKETLKTYGKTKIKDSVFIVVNVLNKAYQTKFKTDMSLDMKKFQSQIEKNILIEPLEKQLISKELNFKHKLIGRTIFNIFVGLLFIAGGGGLFIAAREYGMDWRHYTLWGWVLNTIGGILMFISLGAFVSIKKVSDSEVVQLLRGIEDEDVKEAVTFLDSIHLLPKNLKELIK